MEIRITQTNVILWEMQFSCFRVGSDGIIITRPGISGGNTNKNKVPHHQPEKLTDQIKDCKKERTEE